MWERLSRGKDFKPGKGDARVVKLGSDTGLKDKWPEVTDKGVEGCETGGRGTEVGGTSTQPQKRCRKRMLYRRNWGR